MDKWGVKGRHFHAADPINTERMMEEKKLFFATVIVKRFKQESSQEAKRG